MPFSCLVQSSIYQNCVHEYKNVLIIKIPNRFQAITFHEEKKKIHTISCNFFSFWFLFLVLWFQHCFDFFSFCVSLGNWNVLVTRLREHCIFYAYCSTIYGHIKCEFCAFYNCIVCTKKDKKWANNFVLKTSFLSDMNGSMRFKVLFCRSISFQPKIYKVGTF